MHYEQLAKSVIISNKNRLLQYDDTLTLIGTGRSAFVFKINSTNKVIKVFFPKFIHIAQEEAAIYELLQGIDYYPTIYGSGSNYIVIDYIEGHTLFECLTNGKPITPEHIKEVDYALSLASSKGLNPSDIHLRNIILTPANEIKLIDVARFRQQKNCTQWNDLSNAYNNHYKKKLFPKKLPAPILNTISYLYKNGILPSNRNE